MYVRSQWMITTFWLEKQNAVLSEKGEMLIKIAHLIPSFSLYRSCLLAVSQDTKITGWNIKYLVNHYSH